MGGVSTVRDEDGEPMSLFELTSDLLLGEEVLEERPLRLRVLWYSSLSEKPES